MANRVHCDFCGVSEERDMFIPIPVEADRWARVGYVGKIRFEIDPKGPQVGVIAAEEERSSPRSLDMCPSCFSKLLESSPEAKKKVDAVEVKTVRFGQLDPNEGVVVGASMRPRVARYR